MSLKKNKDWARIALFLGIAIGALTLTYAGYQAFAHYHRQANLQKGIEEKTKEKLTNKTAQLALLFDGIAKDATLLDEETLIAILAPRQTQDSGRRSAAIAAVALRNAFSYLATNKNGTYGKMALLDVNGTEMATAIIAGEYAEANAE